MSEKFLFVVSPVRCYEAKERFVHSMARVWIFTDKFFSYLTSDEPTAVFDYGQTDFYSF